ncbi:MAG: DUF2798 domain-containing protein [Hyphomicrobium sp.]|jgi:hypothetical protein
MARLPHRYAPFLFSVIQAGLTTGVATAVAAFQTSNLSGSSFLIQWLGSWGLAWIMMVPLVIVAAPLIQRSVFWLTDAKPSPNKR